MDTNKKGIKDKINQWLAHDPRRVRPKHGHSMYPLTSDIILGRMKTQLPLHLIRDKKILDLGCSIPFNEIWCNYHGACLYHGVELFGSIAETGNSLISNPNKIFHDTIENFVQNNDITSYDTIIVQSSLNTIFNFFGIFEILCNSRANIIFESTIINESQTPLIKLSPEGYHNTDKPYEVIQVQNFYPNLEAMKVMAKSNSYVVDDFPNLLLQKKLPNWSQYKYCCWMKPTNNKSYQYIKMFK